jgi:hypothetical protein
MMAGGLKDIDSCCLMIQSIENLLISAALVSQCSAYVSPDGTSIEGERAFGCVRNGVLMAGGAMALGVPQPIIIAGLRTLADQTGCGNIVNWNLVTSSDLTSPQNLLPH